MAINTTTSPKAWAPDLQEFLPSDVVPDALIFKAATVVTQELKGDAPVARIPWVADDEARFVAEAAEIEEADPTLSEVTVPTAKIAQLLRISSEQFHQKSTASLLSQSVSRAIVKKANEAFIAQVAPTTPAITPPAGLINSGAMEVLTPISENLDILTETLGMIEGLGGNPSIILVSPTAWADLRKLKTGTGSNSTLLGAGTDDADKRLLGINVVTSPAVPDGKLIVVDPTAIAAAVGAVQIAQSAERYFEHDSIGLRATWRIGWAVQHLDRLAVLTVETVSNGDDD